MVTDISNNNCLREQDAIHLDGFQVAFSPSKADDEDATSMCQTT